MDDLKKKAMELLGFEYPEQQVSPVWQEFEKLLDQAFIRGFNSGRVTEQSRKKDALLADD